MKPIVFEPQATGHLVAVSGLPDITHAFIPNPLPPSWKWPADLWPLLLEAHKALSSLDGTGKHLPDPNVVLRPLQHREAQKSSSLEGTYTDPEQQVLFQLDPKLPSSTDDPINAHREVFNYATALRLRLETQEELPLSLRLIRQLHETLLTGVRGSDRNPGNFRKAQNQVGRPARYVPPPAHYLKELLDQFEKYLHSDRPHDPLVEAFVVHYQFEAIHPFMDGNGRVGRLLLAIMIAEWCNLSNQWLYMSAYFDRRKDEYVDNLLTVSTKGDWRHWIEFCLNGVVEQAHDTIRRCERLIELHREFNEKIAATGGNVRLASIVDDLFVTPVAVVTWAAKKHNVSYPTARTDLKKLERIGILTELNNAPQKSYTCKSILEAIYAD